MSGTALFFVVLGVYWAVNQLFRVADVIEKG